MHNFTEVNRLIKFLHVISYLKYSSNNKKITASTFNHLYVGLAGSLFLCYLNCFILNNLFIYFTELLITYIIISI